MADHGWRQVAGETAAVLEEIRPAPLGVGPEEASAAAAPPFNAFARWMLTEGWNIADPRAFIEGLAARLVAAGIRLTRMRVTIRTLHPQVIGSSYTWLAATGRAEEYRPPHAILQSDQFLKSPYRAIFQGAGGTRRRLDLPSEKLEFPILEDLRAAGATDYVAMPLLFSDGKISAATFATDRPGGFASAELAQIYDMLPALAHVMEMHALRHTARSLLDTYLGGHTGRRVLDGFVKRGDGEDIHAVIWFCDLRESTVLADSMPRTHFLALLNDFFDCMAGAVLGHEGEVLRFIGDAALAIFPIVEEDSDTGREACTRYEACRKALAAARDAHGRMRELNRGREEKGQPPLRFGIGLHIGDVTWGNIGVPERLEFTVVGAAANEAARLEDLCRTLDRSIVLSSRFAQFFPGEMISLGRHCLRGVSEPQEVFSLPDLI